ncbi:MAG: phosphoadenosine phosphosulfate reductase family protein [Niabella sp.]|nr:phosphoadenosine phosphosulfate reductase family protein [Niabella sp.]
MRDNQIICWWSGGVTSAVACKIAIELFGLENCRIIQIGTRNEHPDTDRFRGDCEDWYGREIEIISSSKYRSIQDVWYRFYSLNVASGAICSSSLKRDVRKQFMKDNPDFRFQIFGFDIDEPKRAKAMTLNYPEANPFYPLLALGYTKKKCIEIITEAGIAIPEMYKLGFSNNNCFGTGCVQGGIGYWQKIQRDFPEKFAAMAKVEHELTDMKGEPVTCLKDQAVKKGEKSKPLFLIPHPKYPHIKDISMKTGREPEPLVECNGLCGTYDLSKI